MRGTDVGISKKKIVSRFLRLITLERKGKNKIFFAKGAILSIFQNLLNPYVGISAT